MKNILIIVPRYYSDVYTPPLTLGALAIATYLQDKGYNIKLYDRFSKKESLEHIYETFKPDIVGISVLSTKTLGDAKNVSKFFHKKGVTTVWGGIFTSSMPEIIIKEDYVDFVINGEGEITWEELIPALENGTDLHLIDGLVFKDENGNVVINKERAFIKSGCVPRIDYSLIDVNKYTTYIGEDIGMKFIWLFSSKGCPYHCTFCSNPSYNHCKYRNKPDEIWLDEIRYLITQTECDAIYFADDAWALTREEVYRKCDAIKSLNLKFTWAAFLNLNFLTAEDYQYMYESGCRAVYFGVESGAPTELKRMKKPLNPETIIPEVKSCADAGILPFVSFVLGSIGQTKQELIETAQVMKELAPFSKLDCFVFLPYKGSEMYEQLIEQKQLTPVTKLDDVRTHYPFTKFRKHDKRKFSEASMHDLKVVQAYAHLWGLFNRKENQDKGLVGSVLFGVWVFFNKWEKNDHTGSADFADAFAFGWKYISSLIRTMTCRITAKKYGLKLK